VPLWRRKPIRAAAAVVAAAAVMAGAWPAAAHWLARGPHPAGVNGADALGLPGAGGHQGPGGHRPAGPASAQAGHRPEIVSQAVASSPRHRKPGQPASAPHGYLNPLRGVSGLVPERIDEGVDFGGSGPVYALGDAVVTSASQNSGWPGGGWITYRLTDGPAAGLMVYVAEDVTPAVQPGQRVSASTVVATMFGGGDGIETGWAQPSGVSAESELPQAGSIAASGPFPTMVGVNFDELLQALGVPAAPTPLQPAYGVLPAGYPAGWG
jgi:hypothetical protein